MQERPLTLPAFHALHPKPPRRSPSTAAIISYTLTGLSLLTCLAIPTFRLCSKHCPFRLGRRPVSPARSDTPPSATRKLEALFSSNVAETYQSLQEPDLPRASSPLMTHSGSATQLTSLPPMPSPHISVNSAHTYAQMSGSAPASPNPAYTYKPIAPARPSAMYPTEALSEFKE